MDATTEIRTLADILDELDYYAVLQVDRDAPGSRIRSAYHEASRRFHPDANRNLDPALRERVGAIAKRVAEAYSVLRDPRRRQVYDQQLAESTGRLRVPLSEARQEAVRQRDVQQGRTPNGRRYFALYKADLARGDRRAAERNLRTALTFEPGNELFEERLAALKD